MPNFELTKISDKLVVFRFDHALQELAQTIMCDGYVAVAIAKVKAEVGDVFGYEVHLTAGADSDLNGRKKADFDLNVYPLTEELLRQIQQVVRQ